MPLQELIDQRRHVVLDIVNDMGEELARDASDLKPCGPEVRRLLSMAIAEIRRLVTEYGTSNILPDCSGEDRIEVALRSLFAIAKAKVNAIPFHLVEATWLRLYTDTSILHSALDLVKGWISASPPDTILKDRAFWTKSVSRLDMAIIVAGAIGPRRLVWVQALIQEIQKFGLPRLIRPQSGIDEDKFLPGPNKRQRNLALPVENMAAASSQHRMLFAPNPVPDHPFPSASQYVDSLSSRPFIMRQYLHSPESPSPPWPAVERWRSAEYLLDVVGEGRTVPVEVGTAYDDQDWTQRMIPFRDFLFASGYDVEPESTDLKKLQPRGGPPLYLAQHCLFTQFPHLEKDMALPDLIWSEPSAPPESVATYRPPDGDCYIVNVWVGAGDEKIVSPAHTDPFFNCYAQVLGRKRIWVAPPSSGPYMYAYGNDDTAHDDSKSGVAGDYMTNTSTVPILRAIEDFQSLSKVYPLFFDKVWPHAMEAVLEPGDMLVMPPGWWHSMRGEGDHVCWSVSFWY